eukprot:gnl/MRDRNA2_/MRDRNA2_127657_c0_seq1.p1 gnl/MRDRNA2_/MRDRNA2_127657_c0~~gnl/MRDRNA2_/MRDRNA2_127657_c0_seq1.p1  ORF type:complete len:279 (+),score=46.91 gnl/MRDRNA2_/MRDRNA2_127657_c0_seq1:2-838(+)
MLQNVIKAITLPINSLVLTTIAGLVVMYEYALVAFYYFRRDYSGSCDSVLDCTTTTVYQGLRMDIGSAISPVSVHDDVLWYKRMGFDLTFFIVITTILMNVIFGIIIDAFGSLRDETHSREDHMKNYTFISCIPRGKIEKAGHAANIGCGFEYLEQVKQNRWSYLNFIFFLNRKQSINFTGPESRIYALLGDDDVSWMPQNVCRLMESEDEEAVDPRSLMLELKKSQEEMWERTNEKIESQLTEMRQLVALGFEGDEEAQKKLRSMSKDSVVSAAKNP